VTQSRRLPRRAPMPGLVIHQRRIVVSALDLGEHAVDRAVANLRAALQGARNLLQEPVAILNAQWARSAENGVELFVREPDRGHGQPP
jgi:hypothetical protein